MSGGPKKMTALDFVTPTESYFDPASCNNGEYFHDNQEGDLRMFAVCSSGKNRTKWQYTDINGIICRYHCPAPAGTFIK